MNIPDIAACAALMKQHGMLANIRAHSLMVARIAELLVDGLRNSVPAKLLPNRQLCISGALLHDIAKTPCLSSSENHAKVGASICLEKGFPEIAEIVAGHVVLPDFAPERYEAGIFSACELVYYADKRVRHDSIVSLAERLDYIIDRYGGDDLRKHEDIQNNFWKCKQLEDSLFSRLDFTPEQLATRIEQQASELIAFPGLR